MTETYLIYAKRTPIGRLGGGLSHKRVDDLMADLLIDFKKQSDFSMEEVDEVIVGCANQAGEDNRNLARMAVVLAGFPYSVPGVTLNRLCASSLDAVLDASARIKAGYADCVLVGGAESMTRAPLVVSKGSTPFGRDSKMYDTTFGWRFPNPKMEAMFPLFGMGQTAEELHKHYSISREEQDQFALNSHQKAIAAWDNDLFKNEVLPIEIALRKSTLTLEKDEGPRPDTSLEKLSKLRAVFKADGTVTAGNASSMNDGAALVAVVSEAFLKKHNLKPILRISGAATHGVEPNIMGIGPVGAVQKIQKKFGIAAKDYDVVELNEAFAIQSLACLKDLEIEQNIVNQKGGAIALGHPLGCSGARIVTTLFHSMKDNSNLKKGLATMCVGVGQGVAVSFESCL